jgi:hypothetical protein
MRLPGMLHGRVVRQPGAILEVKRLSARYTRPYLMHGAIGPLTAGRVRDAIGV